MTKENINTGLNITREQMIQLLNEDLAGEYQAIIAYTVYSQVLKGVAYTDIARELELHAVEELQHAIKIARQIDYLGGMPGVSQRRLKPQLTRSQCCARIWRMNGQRWGVITSASVRPKRWENLR